MRVIILESKKQYSSLNRILESVNISLLEMLELAKPIEKAIEDSDLEVPKEFKGISKIDLKKTDTPDNLIASLDDKKEIKIGRLLTQLFPHLKPNEITKIVAKIKLNLLGGNSSDEYEFKLYKDDIGGWYQACLSDSNTSSCMTKDNTKHLPYTYDEMNDGSEHNVSILILYKNDKPFGRALVWYNVKGANKGIFMDRVYPKDEEYTYIHEMFHEYAKNKGWAYRENTTDGGHKKIYNGDSNLKIDLSKVWKHIKIMPYIDTLKYGNADGVLNNTSKSTYTFDKVMGTIIIHKRDDDIINVPIDFKPSKDRTYQNDEVYIEKYGRVISSRTFEYLIQDQTHPLHWLSQCKFEHADIQIDNRYLVMVSNTTWIDGVWVDGILTNSIWENGIWQKGDFYSSTWKKGTWKQGFWDFKTSIWDSKLNSKINTDIFSFNRDIKFKSNKILIDCLNTITQIQYSINMQKLGYVYFGDYKLTKEEFVKQYKQYINKFFLDIINFFDLKDVSIFFNIDNNIVRYRDGYNKFSIKLQDFLEDRIKSKDTRFIDIYDSLMPLLDILSSNTFTAIKKDNEYYMDSIKYFYLEQNKNITMNQKKINILEGNIKKILDKIVSKYLNTMQNAIKISFMKNIGETFPEIISIEYNQETKIYNKIKNQIKHGINAPFDMNYDLISDDVYDKLKDKYDDISSVFITFDEFIYESTYIQSLINNIDINNKGELFF